MVLSRHSLGGRERVDLQQGRSSSTATTEAAAGVSAAAPAPAPAATASSPSLSSALPRQAKAQRQQRQQEQGHMTEPVAVSTLACQVQATQTWRRDLRALLDHASERFADVCWTVGAGDDENEGEIDSDDDEEGQRSETRPRSLRASRGSHADPSTVQWAHKAILYARASNSFQSRYLQLRDPASRLGAMATASTVSLPSIRAPSPGSLASSCRSSTVSHKGPRRSVRGPAPPSSFSLARVGSRSSSRSARGAFSASESDSELSDSAQGVKRPRSRNSITTAQIGPPLSRSGHSHAATPSQDNVPDPVRPSSSTAHGETISVASSTSTVHAPMRLRDITPAFFQATLDFLYTAEESMVDIMSFLYEDRAAVGNGVEERLEKLRQDLVFMWRSRLYSDIDIVVGEDSVRTIPDSTGSVLSLPLTEMSEDEETASFSAHRMILVSRSPYFAAQLLSPYADTNARVIRLPSPPFTPAAVHFTLGFLYTGTLFFSNRTFDLSTAFQLWLAGSYLQVETLQSLVSILIAQDFCHCFACSPPCKTCVKRVPRTLAFVTRPDVSDVRLCTMAESAVSGEHFGSFWGKDVGNLATTTKSTIVANICSAIDERAGFVVTALRQMSIIGTRIDVERSSRWVESLRAMCEDVHVHICDAIRSRLGEVVASKEWSDLIHGVGFSNDVLDKALAIMVDNLDETHAARNYGIIVGNVLLHEDELPPPDVAAIVDEARLKIVRYLTKRWVNVRAAGGFNGLHKWALMELAGEIDVPAADLILPEGAASDVARRTSLRARPKPSMPDAQGSPWASKENKYKGPQPGNVVEGEREAGPIHLRAAVLNRNAARAAVSSSTAGTARTTSSNADMSGPIMTRPRGSFDIPGFREGMTSSRQPGIQPVRATARENNLSRTFQTSSSSTSSTASSGGARTGNGVTEMRRLFEDQSSSKQMTLTTTQLEPTPVQTIRSTVASSTEKAPSVRSMSASVEAYRAQKRAMPTVSTTSRSRATSTASTSTIQSLSGSTNQQPRQAETSRVPAATGSQAVRRQGSATSLRSDKSTRSLRPVRRSNVCASENKANIASTHGKVLTAPTVPTIPKRVLSETSNIHGHRGKQVQVQVDKLRARSEGTTLTLGIPCVIAPRTRSGKQVQLHAIVKYIGPLHGQTQSAIVGVEISLPSPQQHLGPESFATATASMELDFHDGVYQGHTYFRLGTPDWSERAEQLPHKPERYARRQRIAQLLSNGDSVFTFDDGRPASLSGRNAIPSELDKRRQPAAKRQRDLFGTVKPAGDNNDVAHSSAAMLRGLFIRPSEVISIVV